MLGRVCLCIGIVQGPLVSYPDPYQKHFSKRGLGMREEDPPRSKHLMKNLISDPAVCKPLVLQARLTSAREVGLACETSKQYGSIKLTEKMDFESLGSSHLQQQCGLVSKLFLFSVLGEDCGIVICVDVYHKVLISTVIIPLVAFMM